MKSFKEFIAEREFLELLTEWECFKLVPGTKRSYTEHPFESSTGVPKHAHVYAKPKGNGKQVYSVRVDGKGHDGSSGFPMPKKDAKYFRELGYEIPDTNIIETVELSDLESSDYTLLIAEPEDHWPELLLEEADGGQAVDGNPH